MSRRWECHIGFPEIGLQDKGYSPPAGPGGPAGPTAPGSPLAPGAPVKIGQHNAQHHRSVSVLDRVLPVMPEADTC